MVQDPDQALFPGMPRSAAVNVQTDYITSISEMPALLLRLFRESVLDLEPVMAAIPAGMEDVMRNIPDQTPPGMEGRSIFTCPECHGSITETRSGGSLADGQSEMLEQALWTALEESVELNRRLARRAHELEHTYTAGIYDKRVGENADRAALLREVLYRGARVGPSSSTPSDV